MAVSLVLMEWHVYPFSFSGMAAGNVINIYFINEVSLQPSASHLLLIKIIILTGGGASPWLARLSKCVPHVTPPTLLSHSTTSRPMTDTFFSDCILMVSILTSTSLSQSKAQRDRFT